MTPSLRTERHRPFSSSSRQSQTRSVALNRDPQYQGSTDFGRQMRRTSQVQQAGAGLRDHGLPAEDRLHVEVGDSRIDQSASTADHGAAPITKSGAETSISSSVRYRHLAARLVEYPHHRRTPSRLLRKDTLRTLRRLTPGRERGEQSFASRGALGARENEKRCKPLGDDQRR